MRIFEDSEYEAAGGKLVPEGQWPDAPVDHIIIGLKELPSEPDFPLKVIIFPQSQVSIFWTLTLSNNSTLISNSLTALKARLDLSKYWVASLLAKGRCTISSFWRILLLV